MISADIALSCTSVTKIFPVQSDGLSWKIILGLKTDTGEKITALDQISLTVPKGEISGILGRNGAGKSTLLRTLGGVYTPSSGIISVNGDLSGLFELGGGGNQNLTGREFAKRSLAFQQASVRELPRLLAEIRDFSELGDYFDRPIFTYSTGMSARLYFSIATAIPHDVYLIDEILSVGDEHFQNKCWKRMRDLLSNGASGLLVTHDWSAVIKLCRKAHIVDRGKIIFSGAADVTVAKYLNLQMPNTSIAKFTDSLPSGFTGKSGEDFSARIDIEILEKKPISFGYSIELLRLGVGWEVVMMTDPTFLTDTMGKHSIRLSIPKLPISPGTYSLNLFLVSDKETTDVRSWTYGNTLHLEVSGSLGGSALVNLPLDWNFNE